MHLTCFWVPRLLRALSKALSGRPVDFQQHTKVFGRLESSNTSQFFHGGDAKVLQQKDILVKQSASKIFLGLVFLLTVACCKTAGVALVPATVCLLDARF